MCNRKKDIVLKTKGETKRNYLYTVDAVTAILTVLLLKENAIAYNAANENTYCSIYQMAKLVATEYGMKVIINQTKDSSKLGYAPTLKMNLDTTKLKETGWKPKYSLMDMYKRMIDTMGDI